MNHEVPNKTVPYMSVRKLTKRATAVLLTAILSALFMICAFASAGDGSDSQTGTETDESTGSAGSGIVRYTDPATGYRIYIVDEADLLSDEEEEKLVDDMKPITGFGHIIFWSTNDYASNEITQAKEKRYELCGNGSSGIFAVNMRVHKVTFQSDGKIYRYVSSSYARSITDNVSGYLSSKKYYKGASEAYRQVFEVLKGNRIAEPMKYISFIVIGLMLSFVIVTGLVFSKWFNPLVKRRGTAKRIEKGELINGRLDFHLTGSNPRAWVVFLKVIGRMVIEILFRGGSSDNRRSGGGGYSGGGGGGRSGGGRSGGGGGSSRF